jgi:peroxiredoxin
MLKRIFAIFALSSILFSCSQNPSSNAVELVKPIRISGVVNFPQSEGLIILEEINQNVFIAVDTVILNTDNTFVLDVKNGEPGFYRLNLYNKQFINFVIGNNDIEIVADGHSQSGKADVKGSPDTDYMRKVNEIMKDFQSETKKLNDEYMKAKTSKKEDKATNIEQTYLTLQAANTEKIKSLIREMGTSVTALYAINYINADEEFHFLDTLATKFEAAMPKSKYTKEFVEHVNSLRSVAIGQMAPDITLPNPDGEMVSLSSLRGKVVMIDFWAAWCRPCRMENPNVVKAYQEYNDKGFEVFGVSLDRSKDDWVDAIEKDGLVWTQVSDLKYFNSDAARLYNINSIPATFLIDKDGKIIAKNLRGKALEMKLKEIFG